MNWGEDVAQSMSFAPQGCSIIGTLDLAGSYDNSALMLCKAHKFQDLSRFPKHGLAMVGTGRFRYHTNTRGPERELQTYGIGLEYEYVPSTCAAAPRPA